MSPEAENSNLQFEKAEFDSSQPSSLTCQACQKVIQGTYFEFNKKMLCVPCKESVEKTLTGGSRIKRLFLASAAGSMAAFLGAGIYYGIEKLTGYEFGLIAIVVGFMVGAAVRWGAQRRGGWVYQLLAVFLTYNAIVMTYIPSIIEEFGGRKTKKEAVATSSPATIATPTNVSSLPTNQETATANPSSVPPSSPASVGTTSTASIFPKEKISFGKFMLGIGAIFLVAYLVPFLAGVKNIIGLVIIAFGLYEAWKINSKTRWVINGPFQVGPPKT